jgi:hypothetical protein
MDSFEGKEALHPLPRSIFFFGFILKPATRNFTQNVVVFKSLIEGG